MLHIESPPSTLSHKGSFSQSSSRSVDEVVLDLLRGKVSQYYEKLNKATAISSSSATASNVMQSICVCKFLVIIDCPKTPQYWVVQLKKDKNQSCTKKSNENYLNCIDSLELYYSLEDVCYNSNCQYRFSNKNWFFFETIVRISVANGVDILLEDFTQCQHCLNHL